MSSKYLIVLLVAAARVVVEGVSKDALVPTRRMFGGNDAEKGEFSHLVSIQTPYQPTNEYRHQCGGSIINSHWILTAAHCIVPGVPLTSYVVRAGKHEVAVPENNEQTVQIQAAFIHELYTGDVAPYDIALLKLKTPLILNKAVSAARLPEFGAKPTGTGILSGWGSIVPNQIVIPRVPQKVSLSIIDPATCQSQLHRYSHRIHVTNFCTAGNSTSQVSACQGDSGGPLTQKKNSDPVVIGIVSWGVNPCDHKGAPTVYVDVAQFIDWIKLTMKK